MPYGSLLEAFEEAAVSADCGLVEKVQDPCACFQPDHTNTTVMFNCIFHCKDWKWKSSTNSRLQNKRVSIILNISESIKRSDLTLLKSTIHVSYIDVEAGNGKLLQSFHFDYDPSQADHALFHAQITDECVGVNAADLRSLGIDFQLPSNTSGPRLRSARIPTCDMTFPSVLVSLAADHLGGAFFKQFRDKAVELQVKMPLPNVSLLQASVGNNFKEIRSSHWFAHSVS